MSLEIIFLILRVIMAYFIPTIVNLPLVMCCVLRTKCYVSVRTYIESVKSNTTTSLGTKFTQAIHNSITMLIPKNLSCTITSTKSRSSSTQMRISVSTSSMIVSSGENLQLVLSHLPSPDQRIFHHHSVYMRN